MAYVDLSADPVPCNGDISRPLRATRIARLQAELLGSVTNLRHEVVTLNEIQRHLLCRLDGQHDRAAVLAALQQSVIDGHLQTIDPATLDQHLTSLARQSLLLDEA